MVGVMNGKAKNLKDFIVITLGTGLGSGIVSNGKLIEGYDGFAAELGHFSIKNNGRLTCLKVKGGLEEKLQIMTDELSKENDTEKQQNILKSINLLIDTISKLKK